MARPHRAARTISIILALSILGDSFLYPVLPLYAEELGIPLVMVGVVLSMNRWVRLYSNHLAARTFSRYSVYVPIVLASIGAAVSTGIYAFPIGLVGFLLARVVWGVCFSYFRMGSYLVVLQTSRSTMGKALGVMQAVMRLGSSFAVIVGGYLIEKLGYHWTMLLLSLLSAFAIPFALVLKYQLPPELDQHSVEVTPDIEDGGHFSDKFPLSTAFCYAHGFITHLIGSGLVTSSLSLLLKQSVGDVLVLGSLTLGIAAVSALVSSSNWISAILLSAPAGRLSDLYGRRIPYVVSTTLQGGVLLMLAKTSNPLISVISAILFFILTNTQKVFLDAALGDTTTANNRHSVTARYNSYQDLGAALGPLLGYGAAALSGFGRVYAIGALVLLLMTLLPVLTRRISALGDLSRRRTM